MYGFSCALTVTLTLTQSLARSLTHSINQPSNQWINQSFDYPYSCADCQSTSLSSSLLLSLLHLSLNYLVASAHSSLDQYEHSHSLAYVLSYCPTCSCSFTLRPFAQSIDQTQCAGSKHDLWLCIHPKFFAQTDRSTTPAITTKPEITSEFCLSRCYQKESWDVACGMATCQDCAQCVGKWLYAPGADCRYHRTIVRLLFQQEVNQYTDFSALEPSLSHSHSLTHSLTHILTHPPTQISSMLRLLSRLPFNYLLAQ